MLLYVYVSLFIRKLKQLYYRIIILYSGVKKD